MSVKKKKYIINIISLEKSYFLGVVFDNDEMFYDFARSLFLVFAEEDEYTQKRVCDYLQVYTLQIEEKIKKFVDSFQKVDPRLKSFSAFFKGLRENDYFYFIPNLQISERVKFKADCVLYAKTNNLNVEEVYEARSFSFRGVIDKYHCYQFGEYRANIGQFDKQKRVCRFCSNRRLPLAFENTAHAISEALGNKTLRLWDECDECNKYFSKTIESDIIHYLDLFRFTYETQAKKSLKTTRGENFKFYHKDEHYSVFEFNDLPNTDNSYPLVLSEKICLQNIYRCLCKYFLSVIDSHYLHHFKKTIDWINGEIDPDKLYKIAIFHRRIEIKQPIIKSYLRKDDDSKLPFAVGEFSFANLVYVFIIPFSEQDYCDFNDEMSYEYFFRFFKFYGDKGWIFEDFSDNEKKKVQINLHLNIE